jgi:spermidine synthase
MKRNFAIIACFFLSGATALIYEVIWTRMLALTFGNTVYAIGIVLMAFMSGLSLGSYIFGKWADKGKNLLKGYGILEMLIGIFALITPAALNQVASLYVSLSPLSMPRWELLEIEYLFSMLVLIVPTTLMGGTLPIISRYFIRTEEDLEKQTGALYSINTIGGIFGTFLVGFFLIRFFGLSITLKATVFVNICVGIASYYLGIRRSVMSTQESGPVRDKSLGYRYALIAFFLAGFASMIYQVAWTRLLISIIGSATYSFSLILMGFLLGIGLGSMIVAYISRKRWLGFIHFSYIEISIGLIGLATIAFFNMFPSLMLNGLRATDSVFYTMEIEFALIVLYIAVPTTLMGAAFPIIAGVYRDRQENRATNIGKVYSVNTLGAVIGSGLAAFWLLPTFGTVISIKTAAFINIMVGLTGFLVLKRARTFAFAAILLILPFTPIDIPSNLLHTGVGVYGKSRDFSLEQQDRFDIFVKEGLNATISVSAFYDGMLNLASNGKTDASTGDDMSTQLAMGYFPTLLHDDPKEVLIVGFGSGVTVRAALEIANVDEVECVEIEPAVFEAAEYFDSVNDGVYLDPRAEYFIDDARSHIIASKKKYDVIISEPSNPWISGIGNLFSKEFYEISLSRLKDGGIFAQWVQLYSMDINHLKMILKTFSAVFPESSVWQASKYDIMIIGHKEEFQGYDYNKLSKKLIGTAVWDLKAYLNISDPMDLFSYYIMGPEGIRDLSTGAKLNTDDKPLLEFNAPLSRNIKSNAINHHVLMTKMNIPQITGLEGENIAIEFLYRKTENYFHLGIPVMKSWLDRMQDISYSNPLYMTQRAMYYYRKSNLEKANAIIDHALSSPMRGPKAYYLKALLLKDSDLELARKFIERAIFLKNDDFHYYYEAGQLDFEMGDFKNALNHFLQASKMPHMILENSRLNAFIGYSYLRILDVPDAVDYFNRAIEANPYNYEFLIQIADLYHKMGLRSKECELYEKTMEIPIKSVQDTVSKKRDKFCSPIYDLKRKQSHRS